MLPRVFALGTLYVTFNCAVVAAPAPTASTTTLQSSTNPSILGHPVTLTATVSPASATGKVTFYDGVSVLGVVVSDNGSNSIGGLPGDGQGNFGAAAPYLAAGTLAGASNPSLAVINAARRRATSRSSQAGDRNAG